MPADHHWAVETVERHQLNVPEQRHGSRFRTRSSRLVLAALILLTILGNVFTRTLFFGVDFLFGGIFVLIVLRLYGLRWGIPVAALASVATYLIWNHPWAIIIFTAEAAFVGYFLRRKHDNIPLLVGAYWMLIGIPLVIFFYGIVMHVNASSVTLIAFKQSLNGIFNALIASLIIVHTPLRRWAGFQVRRTVPLQLVLFNMLVSLVLFPAIVLTIMDGYHDQKRVEQSIQSQLGIATRSTGHRMEGWKNSHLRAVYAVADIAATLEPGSRSRLQRSLSSVHRAFPDFHNMYVANARGTTIAFDPLRNEQGQSTIGLNFSDREYFRRLQVTKRPVFSDVFQGRGGVIAPIVTVSVPVLRNGEFDGFALGALDLSATRGLLRDAVGTDGMRATLLDEHSRVIASTNPDLKALGHFHLGQSGMVRSVDPSIVQWQPKLPGAPAVVLWENSYYVQRFSDGIAPWELVIEAPVRPYFHFLQRRYTFRMGVLLALSVATLVLAFLFTRFITRPLTQLASVTTNLPEKLLSGDRLPWPSSGVSEVASLVANYQAMLASLNQHFRALRTSEMRFRTVVEQSPIGIMIFDPDGRCLQTNHAWDDLCGRAGDSWRHQNILEDPEWSALGIRSYLERALQNQPVSIPPMKIDPVKYKRPGRPRWLEAFLYPVEDEFGHTREIVWMVQDITDRRAAEEERLELLARERLARGEAERLYKEAQIAAGQKDDFLAMLAHELRNPLGVVSNALHLLSAGQPDAETWSRSLEILRRQVHHQNRLVDDLLDVSRINRGKVALKLEPLDLAALVRESVQDNRRALEQSGLSVSLNAEPGPIWVDGDPTRLSQVLSNLLHNAQKFTPEGGQVTVSLKSDPDASLARVSVSDSGEGISHDALERIFDPFIQGKRTLARSEGGLGLGLSLVRDLVRLHGGGITAQSEGHGEGAEFSFWLPLGSEPADRVAEPEAEYLAMRALRILVIEDNPDAAESLRDMLELNGHTVETALNGQDGLNTVGAFRPEVVLCDIGLPGMDGYQVAAALRQMPEACRTILVAITGYGREEDRQRSQESGFDLHLTKPVNFAELNRLLMHAVQNTRPG